MDTVIGRYIGHVDDDLIKTTRGVAYQRDMQTIKYNGSYFDKCANYRGTEIAEKINKARVSLVRRHTESTVLDIGIGSGEFIESIGNAYGFDINDAAVRWLEERGLYRGDLENFHAFTFWDVLEHIENPGEYFNRIRGYVFCSLPIFDSLDEIRESKHYRPNEHLYYFTLDGFAFWMECYGFRCLETNNCETQAGRDSIRSFAFFRDKPVRKIYFGCT